MNEFMKVRCQKDDKLEYGRNVEYSCGCEFNIKEKDIYSVSSLDYFVEKEKKNYYVICPFCGYINVLDSDLIPEEVKRQADYQSREEPLLFHKNNLRSELIYLDRVSPPVLKRVR